MPPTEHDAKQHGVFIGLCERILKLGLPHETTSNRLGRNLPRSG
jgi:hypothetical protein